MKADIDVDIEEVMDPEADRLTREQSFSLRHYMRNLLLTMTAALVLAMGSMFFLRPSLVRGNSMAPTLMNGDCTLVQIRQKRVPSKGEVVVIRDKEKPDKYLVKRIIATGGDTVQIDFEAGEVFVNGKKQTEPYVNGPTNLRYDVRFPVTVPPGCFFVLGDNRNDSKDSRSSALGFVPLEDIQGRVLIRLLPIGRIGRVE